MNKQQKQVLQTQLSDEEKILKWLKQVYGQAAKDTADKIAELSARTDMENLQSIIYQKKYQEAILKQIQGTLDQLQSDSFLGISDYLGKCYETGYVGAMYDLAGQGIPIISPIDQKQVVRALQTDTKLSQGLYDRLGEDTTFLKKKIKAELSRGVVEGKSYNDIAKNIAKGMTSPFNTAKNNAMRIARTEGHRIQLESQNDALYKAKDKGANIVKQWDSTLDARTRDSHARVDGEIRELDKKFSNGLMFPSDPNGSAAEVVNCRCCLLQRAKWMLDADELDTLQKKAEYFGLDKTENFEEFKTQYLKISKEDMQKVADGDIIEAKLGGLEGYPKSHHKAILKYLDDAPEEYREAWNDVCEDFHILTTGKNGAYYSPAFDGVKLSIRSAKKGSDYQTPYQVLFHEYGHHMDYCFNRKYGDGNRMKAFSETYKNGIFGQTLKKEANSVIEKFALNNKITTIVDDSNRSRLYFQLSSNERSQISLVDWFASNKGKEVIDRALAETKFCEWMKSSKSLIARSDISDMFEPVMSTAYPFGVGHGKSYWSSRDNGKEGFAEMYSAAINNPDSWDSIQEYFPESVKIFKEMLKVVK